MAPLKRCKRMTVHVMGVDKDGRIEYARNGNRDLLGCRNIPGRCGCDHAEYNLLRKMPNPVAVTVSHSPCMGCARRLVNAGVKTVTFLKPYRISDGITYLEENGVLVFDASQ
jgi:tRNA(Arg) A34 adenosine deaminase TadA